MTRILTATEAKAKMLGLLDEVAAGDEIQITKHGHLVARLIPVGGSKGIKGSLSGTAISAVDEEELFSTGIDWDLP
jgi:prevent-host-death family protein